MIIFQPRDSRAHLLVKFVYIDLPRVQPCEDSLSLCETLENETTCDHNVRHDHNVRCDPYVRDDDNVREL